MPMVQKFDIAKRLTIITQQAQDIVEQHRNDVCADRVSLNTILRGDSKFEMGDGNPPPPHPTPIDN